jgi:cytoskeletal protein CcmA (bactofilin family)
MWNKVKENEAPGAAPVQAPVQGSGPAPAVVAFNTPAATRPSGGAPARGVARLGSSVHIKGTISGSEDLQIDGKVEGAISLRGHGLTIGASAQLNSEIEAREVVVYGKVTGNVHARDRVDVKTDGSIIGDISTARISIEDGAHFKGRIEIDPTKTQALTA